MFGWIPRLLAWIAQWHSAHRAGQMTAPQRDPATLLMIEQQMQQWR
ncbi:MAG: hypothetical protein K8S97_06880 [Anaerolineae bacterium]|nr:hypothetical protein [Anaerolineae bacterium]